jgi:hypothetical protein
MLLVFSCQSAPGVKQDREAALPVEEQEALAEETFKDLLQKTGRMEIIEKNDILLAGYQSIIANYPDSYLAHESYYHMVRHLLFNYNTSREAEAEKAYREYLKKYENGTMKERISFEIAKYYYERKRWKKLISFTVPFMREYVSTGRISDSLYAFYYSEARYHLKEYDEAIRGYMTYKKIRSGGGLSNYVDKRLKELKHLKDISK